jgi:transcriptional regulator with XRE-family HTH domain
MVLQDVARRVAELRHDVGWTQQQLADAMGLDSDSWVKQLESGRENLTLRSLHQVAEVLGVDVRELFECPERRGPRRPGRPRKHA